LIDSNKAVKLLWLSFMEEFFKKFP
jgi:hypothetical protein